ncbi:MAG: flagellar biosynthesis anti-sigma factor FlgM [Pseudomonadota bacterium]
MKINDSKKSISLPLGQTPANKADKAGAAPAPAVGSPKSSSTSPQLQSLQGAIATSEVFDAGKVEAIKSAIADGKFKVNAEKVADGLLTTVKNLLQARKN